jgi:hypothetical protein
VAALDADVFDSLYAELRDCRDHCDGKRNVWITGLRGRTGATGCRPHTGVGLPASTIRQIPFHLERCFAACGALAGSRRIRSTRRTRRPRQGRILAADPGAGGAHHHHGAWMDRTGGTLWLRRSAVCVAGSCARTGVRFGPPRRLRSIDATATARPPWAPPSPGPRMASSSRRRRHPASLADLRGGSTRRWHQRRHGR